MGVKGKAPTCMPGAAESLAHTVAQQQRTVEQVQRAWVWWGQKQRRLVAGWCSSYAVLRAQPIRSSGYAAAISPAYAFTGAQPMRISGGAAALSLVHAVHLLSKGGSRHDLPRKLAGLRLAGSILLGRGGGAGEQVAGDCGRGGGKWTVSAGRKKQCTCNTACNEQTGLHGAGANAQQTTSS